jgi:UDP-N-acetylmuramate: L-alanyl-gamma-D-glutamyl-meso-diaminopimelate ligase
MKNMPMLDNNEVANAFGENIHVFNTKNELRNFILNNYTKNENLLLMSSGNFDGMDLNFG